MLCDLNKFCTFLRSPLNQLQALNMRFCFNRLLTTFQNLIKVSWWCNRPSQSPGNLRKCFVISINSWCFKGIMRRPFLSISIVYRTFFKILDKTLSSQVMTGLTEIRESNYAFPYTLCCVGQVDQHVTIQQPIIQCTKTQHARNQQAQHLSMWH
jgi:hypothetical protein